MLYSLYTGSPAHVLVKQGNDPVSGSLFLELNILEQSRRIAPAFLDYAIHEGGDLPYGGEIGERVDTDVVVER